MVAPKLRFKEFSGDWKHTSLKKIINTLDAGVSVNSEDISPTSLEASILKTSCITSGIFDKNERKRVLDNNEISRLKEPLLDDSILISRMNTPLLVGMSAYIKYAPKNTYLPDRLWQIKLNKNITNTRWLAFNLGSDKGFQKLKDLATGTSNSMKNISKKDVLNIEIFVPCIVEQTKIANFLTQVDQKIEQLTQKHALLTQYKKGMMQKLFSQQIRFKSDDGSEFGEWLEYPLKKISNIYDGTHQTPTYVSSGIPFYSVEHVTANNFSKTKFISTDVYIHESKRVKLEKNDILMTRIGDIGTSKLIDWNVQASFYVSLALLKFNSKNVDPSFINQYIKGDFFQSELHKRTIHVAFPKKINLGEIGLCLINLPTLPEQTKIANFLSSIDQKIDITHQQLQRAKQWKKGLLQQMFV